ncbi:PAS domain S-box protein [Halomicrobium salinisoli]|uniref:PAS domain S-box protein n=1 Tax=Halomicrobium salinisoli TaxID=2878391 RepID=UPI001CF01927|nr:PAS domain S-box protein [Halomicrobium salinisoli]
MPTRRFDRAGRRPAAGRSAGHAVAVVLAAAVAAIAWTLLDGGSAASPWLVGLPGLAAGDDAPIEELTAKVRRLAAGEDVEFPTERDDAVGELSDALSELAASVAASDRNPTGTGRPRADDGGYQADPAATTERQLAAIVENTESAIYIKDADGVYRFANQAVADFLGLDRESIVGATDEDLFGPATAADARADDRHVMETGESISREVIRPIDGEDRVFLDNKYPYTDADGGVIGVMGVSRDVTDLTERERELRETKRRLELTLEGTNTGIWEWNLETDEVTWNETMARLVGMEPGEFEGTLQAFNERIHPDDRDQVQRELTAAIEADDVLKSEFRLFHESGDVIWVSVRGRFLDDDGDRRVVGINNDVTERKAAERELRETKRRLELALEGTNTGLWEWDPETDEITWNDALERLLGLEPGEFEGTYEGFVDRVHPEDLPRVEETLADAMAADGQYQSEFRMRRADGDVIWVNSRGRLVDDGSERLVGVTHDVTERKSVEQALREREEELREYRDYTEEILDAVDDVFYVLDEEGRVQRWNESLVETTGYSDDELDGMHARTFFAEESRADVEAAIREAFDTGDARVEAPYLTKDGDEIPHEFVATGLTDPDGNPIVVGIGRDVTERVETERELSRLISNVPGYVYRVANDPEWSTEYVSEGIREITGYDPEAVERGDVDWIEDVELDGPDWPAVHEAAEAGEAYDLTYSIETADGEQRWIRDQGRAARAPDGTVEGIEGVVIDVTERIEYERELERTRDLLQHAQRIGGIGGWEVDLRSDPYGLFWTDEVYRIHGLEPDADVDLEDGIDYYHPEDRERIREAVRRAIEEGEPYDVEARLVTDDGEQRWVRSIGEPVREDGEVVTVRGSILDITEPKERQRELEVRSAAIEASIDGVAILDENYEFVYVNRAHAELYGYDDPSEMVGEKWTVCYGEAERERLRAEAVASLREQGSWRGEAVGRRTDGSEYPQEVSLTGLSDGGVVCVVRDVTERREREAELERTSTLLRQTQRLAGVGGWEYDVEEGSYMGSWTEGLYDIYEVEPGEIETPEDLREYVHPDDRERVREIGERSVATGEGFTAEHRIVTGEGRERWVRVTSEPTADGERFRGAVLDVTDQKERERTLRSLHETARDLLATESDAEVAELAVETARSVLDVAGVCAYLVDEGSNRLVPVAATDAFGGDDGPPPVDVGADDAVWESFATGSPMVVDATDDRDRSVALGNGTDGGLLVPVGEHGVFVVAADPDRIDDEVRRLAGTLVATTEAALDRLDSEAALRARDEELAARNERLRRQMAITDIIRRVDQSLVAAESREDVERTVCERLVESDDVAFAWIGRPDEGDQRLVPQAWAGDGEAYLDGRSLSFGSDEPASVAARTGEATVVPNVVDRLQAEDWRQAAVSNGFHSVVAVPLSVDEYSHGVLAVYADEPEGFGDLERTVFAELGRTIANAVDAVTTRTALHADTLVELTLAFDEADEFLARVAREADCEATYEGIATHSADETRLFFATTGAACDAVAAVLEDSYAVDDFRLIDESGDQDGEDGDGDDDGAEWRCLFEATVSGPVLASALVRRGASPRAVRATPDGTEAVVDASAATDVREFVETLAESYPSVELVKRRTVERSMATRQELVTSLLDGLTDRQREVLRTAYYAGFFEWPRTSTGEEVAEMLDVTQPTVNRHLRLAQGALLAQLFDEEAAGVVAT